MAAAHIPTYYQDRTRVAEVPAADWVGGMNKAGSNAPGIGIGTGDKHATIPTPNIDNAEDSVNKTSQNIGAAAGDIEVVEGADINNTVMLKQAAAPVAPDGDLGGGAINRTGQTVDTGEWAFGVVQNA